MPFTLQIGQKAPDFNLPGVDGKQYSLATFDHAKILVVLFSCNHCPYVIGSLDRIISFHTDYALRGLAMIAINSNETENHPTDSFEHMKQLAKEKRFPFPYVHDHTQQIALKYGALRTPHFYLFDSQRTLRYTGRMDDNPRNPGVQKTHELRDAVEALLAGNKVPLEITNPIGCNVKWKGHENHWLPPEACDLV
jgi:peroxiredoxin